MKVLGVPAVVWRRLCMINVAFIVILASVAIGLPRANAQNVSIGGARNCDANAVIFCGASSVNQLINKVDNGDGRNSAASIQNILAGFGISRAEVDAMANAGADVQAGSVTKSGQVLDGQGNVVASGAMTGGRQNIAGSTRMTSGGTVFFMRPPSVSFLNNSLPAFVVMHNGRFAFAILASCGNAVSATPKAPKPAPAAAPVKPPVKQTVQKKAPCSGRVTNTATNSSAAQGGNCSTNTVVIQQTQQTQQQSGQGAQQTQSATQSASPPTQSATQSQMVAAPAQTQTAQCVLNATQDQNDIHTVTATANATGVSGMDLLSTSFDFGDGSVTAPATGNTATHTYAGNGTFTITATMHFNQSMPSATQASAPVSNGANTSGTDNTANTAPAETVDPNTGNVTAGATDNTAPTTNTGNITDPEVVCQTQVTIASPQQPAPAAPAAPAPVTPAVAAAAPAPTQLVNTGTGGAAIGVFVAASTLGTIGYYYVTSRRLGRI